MSEHQTVMGFLAVEIMLIAYGVQLWKTWLGKSEPHPIAWFGFGFLTGVGYLIQVQKGAGAGSWVMGMTAIFCFLVGGMSQYKKRWKMIDFDFWDWAALAMGTGLFVLYLISQNLSWGPLVAAILVTTADLVLYIPIFRKAWISPQKENATAYALNGLKFVPSLLAMGAYSVETCLYAGAMVVINPVVAFYLCWRRIYLGQYNLKKFAIVYVPCDTFGKSLNGHFPKKTIGFIMAASKKEAIEKSFLKFAMVDEERFARQRYVPEEKGYILSDTLWDCGGGRIELREIKELPEITSFDQLKATIKPHGHKLSLGTTLMEFPERYGEWERMVIVNIRLDPVTKKYVEAALV